MAVQPFGQLCVTMVVTKNRATMLSRSALALWGRAGIESSSNRVKGPSFVEQREILHTRGKICFFSPLYFALLFGMQSNGQARMLLADSLLPRCIAIDWISMRNYLTRLRDRCGKPTSFTMAPTIYPRLPSVMKGIRHKAEVWLSRESKQARTPFWSASFLMSCRGAKRLAEREREAENILVE